MRTKEIFFNQRFIGRTKELVQLAKIGQSDKAHILILYGRRRVGKTELIEQAYRDRNILKFEGLEGRGEGEQRFEVMRQLGEYSGQPLLVKIQTKTWQEVFQYIADVVRQGRWTIYFEEVQWLANYESAFVAGLKYVWDNYFRHNNDLLLILCGSSPSFMIKEIVHSKALYNRSTHEMALTKLDLIETQMLLHGHGQREIMDAYLTVGGIPEYLQWLQEGASTFLSLCQQAFKKNGSFLREFDKVFVSSLSNNPHYKKIVEFLAKKRFATREEIAKHVKVTSGGSLTKILEDLLLCEFIQKYSPYNLNSDSPLARYCISDEYLQFYYQFIKPIKNRIKAGEFDSEPTKAISIARYHQWLGYAFERFCRHYYRVIAKILGFSGVDFKVGSFFNRAINKENPGYQIDLLFERKDRVYTVCEVKYVEGCIGTEVIEEIEKKLKLFPNKKDYTIQRVLITNAGADQALMRRSYFDKIITFKELFDESNWK